MRFRSKKLFEKSELIFLFIFDTLVEDNKRSLRKNRVKKINNDSKNSVQHIKLSVTDL